MRIFHEAKATLPGRLQRSLLFASFVSSTNETADVAQCQSTAIYRAGNDHNNHSVMPTPEFKLGLESFPGI